MIRSVVMAVLAAAAVIFLIATSTSIEAQAPRAHQPYRTASIATRRPLAARRSTAQRCAGCHGPALAGAQAPPLAGSAFTFKWRKEPLSALFIKIRYTMPPNPAPDATPRLTPEQGADLVAHVLKTNGFPAGKTDFAAADATDEQHPLARCACGRGRAALQSRPGIRQPARSTS